MDRRTYMRSFVDAHTCGRHPLGWWLHRQLNRHPLVWWLHWKLLQQKLFLVPNSLLYFNIEENGFMKILRTSYSLNRISTVSFRPTKTRHVMSQGSNPTDRTQFLPAIQKMRRRGRWYERWIHWYHHPPPLPTLGTLHEILPRDKFLLFTSCPFLRLSIVTAAHSPPLYCTPCNHHVYTLDIRHQSNPQLVAMLGKIESDEKIQSKQFDCNTL